jgi:hypothetical protein
VSVAQGRVYEIVVRTEPEELIRGPIIKKYLSPKREPKYQMETVTEEVDHPTFGRITQPVTYRDKNGVLRVRKRRAKS